MKPNKTVIGLTGNIGSGKSTATKYLIKRGFYVIDADIVAREVVMVGSEGLKLIEEVFGSEFIQEDGTLDRKKLGSHVFGNSQEIEKLNQILHPIIRRRLVRSVELTQERVIFIDAALIFETGMNEIMDLVWLIAVDEEVQIERLMQRDEISREAAQSRMRSQMSQMEKAALADHVLDNNGSKEQLHEKIDALIFTLGLDKAESTNYN